MDERRQAGHRAEARLRVHRPELDRAEPRVRADVPPQECVVGGVAGLQPGLDVGLVLGPAGERGRDDGAREAAEELRAGAREAGVPPVPVRGVGGEPLQHGQVGAQPGADADRALRVGHADVHVQRTGGRAAHEPAHRGGDRLVALARHVRRLAERRVGVDAAADQGRARLAHARPHRTQRGDRLGGIARDRRGGLDLGLVDVGLGDLAESRQQLADAMGERERVRVDQQQLLLHAEGERLPAAEGVVHGQQYAFRTGS